ncbi:MAG: hypothetical protein NBV61_07700 [Algoriphagus sp.]|nr:hypothetical protein [Algoriphagus sp.]
MVQALEEDYRSPDLLFKLVEKNLEVFDYLEMEEKFISQIFKRVVAKDPSKIRKMEWSYTLSDSIVGLTEGLNIQKFINLFEVSDFAEALAERYSFESVIFNSPTETEVFKSTEYYLAEPGLVTLGYDRNCYLSEKVAGEISDETLLEFLESGEGWSDFIWSNSWFDFASIFHTYGMGEPATDMQLPNGKLVEISLNYEFPHVDDQEECLSSSEKGSFVHISASDEKAYGWGKWKTYSLEVPAGVIDIAKISVQFEGDIVYGYRYHLPDGTFDSFEENPDYQTTGQGFSSTLYFNNGKELIEVDELSELLEENEIDSTDIKAIRKFLMQYTP